MNFSLVQSIFKDKLTVQLFSAAIVISACNFYLCWFYGVLSLLTLILAFALSSHLEHNDEAKRKIQDLVISLLSLKLVSDPLKKEVGVEVDKELDAAIESFFRRIIKTFISSWYSNVTQDETFLWNVKVEIAEAIRNIAIRLKNIDLARLISNKLLPVAYSHFDILGRIDVSHDQVAAFVENEIRIHPAAFNRPSEINFLRFLSRQLLGIMSSTKNYDCEVLQNLLQEILTCSVLLPLTDIIADPAIINLLVILATSARVPKTTAKQSGVKKVLLLENFTNKFRMNLDEEDDDDGEQYIDGNFLKDQQKLYSFMQFLKTRRNLDIELLKFYLDVEHLNSELDKPSVCDPVKLSELQEKSEKLLIFYQNNLFHDNRPEKKPDDLCKAHEQARQILESKWRNEFYKSAEYYEFIYGERETSTRIHIRSTDVTDATNYQPKFASKLKNVMNIKPVEGLEATEIPIWDALDHPLGHSSYYNSVAVKLRKERGQDLDSFMQTFFHSIDQEADMGEDIASTQTQEEAKLRLKKKLSQGNIELFKNLFNISRQPIVNDATTISHIKSPVDSAIYFLASILNVHKFILKLFIGFVQILPDADRIIDGLIIKFIRSVISEPILAKLITELEEKIFDSNPSTTPTHDELIKRRELAMSRIKSVNGNLTNALSLLQNPVINKHLVYCLIDVIAVELFPELNLDAKD